MKKIILFSAIALLVLAIVGCEKKVIKEDCECKVETIEGEKLNPINNKPAVIKYSEYYEAFVVELDESEEGSPNHTFVPCGNSLPKKYNKENLQVMITGFWRNCSRSAPNAKFAPFYKINITSIKINTK